MVIDMPFLHRFRGTTGRKPDVRELAGWDIARILIPDYSLSDFDTGISLSDRRTLYRDGYHWANISGTHLGLDQPYDPEERGHSPSLIRLAKVIGCQRFFDTDGSTIRDAAILARMPAPENIHLSQRDSNVSRLADWAADNIAAIDGKIFVRIREPSIALRTHQPSSQSSPYLTVGLDRFMPEGTRDNFGVLFATEEIEKALDRAAEIQQQVGSLWTPTILLGNDTIAALKSTGTNNGGMERRTIVSTARQVSEWGLACDHNMHFGLFAWEHRSLPQLANPESSVEDLDAASELLQRTLEQGDTQQVIVIREAINRWNDRDISLSFNSSPLASPS